MKEADILMHLMSCLCKYNQYLHDHGSICVQVKVAQTNGGYCSCVFNWFKGDKGVEDNLAHVSWGHCCTLRGSKQVCMHGTIFYATICV